MNITARDIWVAQQLSVGDIVVPPELIAEMREAEYKAFSSFWLCPDCGAGARGCCVCPRCGLNHPMQSKKRLAAPSPQNE